MLNATHFGHETCRPEMLCSVCLVHVLAVTAAADHQAAAQHNTANGVMTFPAVLTWWQDGEHDLSRHDLVDMKNIVKINFNANLNTR